jgi:CBS domain-containing protein
MKVKDIMTSPVISIEPDATILQAIRMMLQRHISGLPVVDGSGRLVGIVTEGDFLRRAETGTQRQRPRWLEFLMGPGRLADEYTRTHARKVGEVMTLEPVTITEDTPLEEAVHMMERRRFKRLPVVRNNQLVGIISRANLLHALASLAPELKPHSVDDATIREQLMAELQKQTWAPTALLDVVVRNGVVELWGSITDDRERQALKVAAENIPGVKSVVDHLVWVDPTSGMMFSSPADDADQKKAS